MYSVVLMAALTANAAEAPSFFRHSSMGCCGGLYAHSGAYASCMGFWGAGGGCNGGYWGSSYGCYGGWDSGSGYAGGCWGSCHGGQGGHHHRRQATSGGCYGCMGCYGSWAGYGEYMTPGMYYPSGANNPMSVTPAMPGSGTTTAPGGTVVPGTGVPGATTPPAGGGGTPMGGGTSAKLIIEKPADAKLFVDDQPIKTEGARNTFSTPTLDPFQAYYYMVRVEMDRDGKPVSETRRVIVRAGETVQETFREPAITTALNAPTSR